MLNHIRFRRSFDAYTQGKMYKLPEELAALYVKAGVAEVVDYVPKAAEHVHEPAKTVTDDASDGAEPATVPKRKRS